MHVGQGKGLGLEFHSFRLDDELVKDLTVKVHGLAVWLDRPRLDILDPNGPLEVRNLNVGVFLPIIGQHLDPRVVRLELFHVVGVLFSVEENGARPRIRGVIFHRQLFG